MNFVSFVCLFLFPLLSVWEKMEWNGQKQTNKQSILEAAHRDHEMVIEAFPIWGWGGGGGYNIRNIRTFKNFYLT